MQEVAAAAPFDRVAGERERGAGEADQRNVLGQVGAGLRDRLEDEVERLGAFELDDAVDVVRLADRVVNLRAVAGGELEVEPHRFEDRQQVGEDDRGVDAEAVDGGAHHLAAELAGSCRVRGTIVFARTSRYSAM